MINGEINRVSCTNAWHDGLYLKLVYRLGTIYVRKFIKKYTLNV